MGLKRWIGAARGKKEREREEEGSEKGRRRQGEELKEGDNRPTSALRTPDAQRQQVFSRPAILFPREKLIQTFTHTPRGSNSQPTASRIWSIPISNTKANSIRIILPLPTPRSQSAQIHSQAQAHTLTTF